MPKQRRNGRIRHILYATGAVAVQQLCADRIANRIGIGRTGALDLQPTAQADILAGRSNQNVIRATLDLKLVGQNVEVSCLIFPALISIMKETHIHPLQWEVTK